MQILQNVYTFWFCSSYCFNSQQLPQILEAFQLIFFIQTITE
jgi:hypothetical protein